MLPGTFSRLFREAPLPAGAAHLYKNDHVTHTASLMFRASGFVPGCDVSYQSGRYPQPGVCGVCARAAAMPAGHAVSKFSGKGTAWHQLHTQQRLFRESDARRGYPERYLYCQWHWHGRRPDNFLGPPCCSFARYQSGANRHASVFDCQLLKLRAPAASIVQRGGSICLKGARGARHNESAPRRSGSPDVA